MPLMMGDWIMGTRGMRADVKGVYIGLLIHQYDEGFIPDDLETLSLIEPEVGKVWVLLKDKFPPAGPGQLKNLKLEEVRAFWDKQGQNGKKGGRPKKTKPKQNPNHNPKANPNNNHHNDLDLDNDTVLKNKKEPDFEKPDVDGETITMPYETDAMRKLWAGWKKYRWNAYQARYPMMGEQADLQRLQGMTYQQIEKAVLEAIAKNWKHLYPEHGKQNNGFNAKPRKESTADLAAAFAKRHGTTPPSSEV